MIADDIADMERRLAERGRTVKSLCDDAGVNQSTWTRWKAGTNGPTLSTWGKVKSAFDQIMLAPTPDLSPKPFSEDAA